jgi:hypothetical protein
MLFHSPQILAFFAPKGEIDGGQKIDSLNSKK